MAHEIEDRMGVVMVVMGLGDRRANRRPGMVEELVLQPCRHMRDCLAVGFGQVGREANRTPSSRWRIWSAWLPSC